MNFKIRYIGFLMILDIFIVQYVYSGNTFVVPEIAPFRLQN